MGGFTHSQRDGPRRGLGGERKAPWSPSQRRNLLRYGEKKERPVSCLPQGNGFSWEVSPTHKGMGPEGVQGASGKPPWSPPQRRNPLRYGARKEGPFPAFHLKFVPCGRFRPPAGGRGTFPHGKVPKGCRGRPKGACLMAAPGPPGAKLQCTASLAGVRPAGFTSVPGRAAVAFGAVDPSPGVWAPVYPWSHGKVPPRSGCLGATLPWTVRHAQKIGLQVLLSATLFFCLFHTATKIRPRTGNLAAFRESARGAFLRKAASRKPCCFR